MNADKLIASGMMNIDETRDKAGLTPTGEKWARRHYITKIIQLHKAVKQMKMSKTDFMLMSNKSFGH